MYSRVIQLMKASLILAITGLFLTGCQALQRVDQGLYSAAESVSQRDRVTGQRTLSLAGRNEQIARGNAAVEQMLAAERKAGRPINAKVDAQMYRRLVTVFDRIHKVSHLRDERWEPILIDQSSFNAFTTGGTYIVVHAGLMKDVQSDDELAVVLGHEIAHTVANHVFERQTHQTAALIAGSKAAQQGGYQAAFTHESEIEADRVGILYAALAGFDPYAASRIWERQYKKEGSARGLFFHDHPVNPERAAMNRKVADQVNQYVIKGRQNPQFVAILDNNVLWQKRQSGAQAGEGGGLAAVLSTALGAYVQHQETKVEANRQARQMQIIQALDSKIKVLEQKRVDANSWQVLWQNGNNVAMRNVVMGVLIKDSKGKIKRYVAHIQGDIRPGQRYAGRFTMPDMRVDQIQGMQIKYYLDDALPYR